mmetsp:Transcript_6422/g.14048  ORF Transcript_6422/g.14048 Transcript_6422/m.14048 type:complete len:166 (+) Transcript_6422:116-613(+)
MASGSTAAALAAASESTAAATAMAAAPPPDLTDPFRSPIRRGLRHIATKRNHDGGAFYEVLTNDANSAIIDSSRCTSLPPLSVCGVPPHGNLSLDQRSARRPPARTDAWTTPGNYWYIVHRTSCDPNRPEPSPRARARNLTSTLSRIQGFGAPLPGPAVSAGAGH